MRSLSFFTALTFTVALLVGATLWANYRADPYALFHGAAADNGRDHRDLFFNLRLHKPYAMTARRPRALLLGSSTLGPFKPELVFGDRIPAYNAALPGATLLEMRRMLEHAQALAPVDQVIIGLEFYQFRAGKRPAMPGFAEHRLLSNSSSPAQKLAHEWQVFLDHWSALFSRSALEEARQQKHNSPRSNRAFYRDGSWQNVDSAVSSRWLFNLIAAQKYAEFSELDNQLDFVGLGHLIDRAESGGTAVLAVISPLHAYTLHAIDMAGGTKVYRQWLRQTVDYLQERGIAVVSLIPTMSALAHQVGDEAGLYVDGIHYGPGGALALGSCLRVTLQGKACEGTRHTGRCTRAI